MTVIFGALLASGALACSGSDDDAERGSDDLMGTGGSGGGGPEGCGSEGTPNEPLMAAEDAPPIVFVHGFAGSAQQYQSQAIRFVANGYPPDHIFDYDHDGQTLDVDGFTAGLDAVVDRAISETGHDRVYLIGHSRGTTVSNAYLGTPARAAKVAKYVSLDGQPCPTDVVADCINLNQLTYPGQAHVEVATSEESFIDQYEYFVGGAPKYSDISRKGIGRQPGCSEISGRVVLFPENLGRGGVTMEIYEVDPATGFRLSEMPIASVQLDDTGSFGPIEVHPEKYYEKAVLMENGNVQHFYTQPYLRSSRFVRVLSGTPDGNVSTNTHSGPNHSAAIVLRMREWLQADVLNVSVQSESGNTAPIDVGDALGADMGLGSPIAFHLHDSPTSPGESTLGPLADALAGPFQTTADLYMPGNNPPDGTITFESLPRGASSRPQVIRTPNWAEGHMIMVMFNDYPLD
jgi:pimeloyl-ACP methyl ester carboxylesterase